MLDDRKKAFIRQQIAEDRTQQYLSAYLSGIGANIHVGEKRARKLAREAGCCALKYALADLAADHEEFARACQFSFDTVMNEVIQDAMNKAIEEVKEKAPSLLVPDHCIVGANGKPATGA